MPSFKPFVYIALLVVACTPKAAESPASTPAEAPGEAAPAAPAEASAPAPAPEDATSTDFTTLAEAERALEQAQSALGRLGFATPPPATSAGPEPARAREESEQSPGAAAEKKADGGCHDACRAFGSLERAASAVCRLDTESGERCTRAKQIVSDAERRVASCGCQR